MSYVDCYLVPMPRENKAAYEQLARLSATVVREHGALRVLECWMDESGPESTTYHAPEVRMDSGDYVNFASAAGAREGETVVISYVEWPDRQARDAGMQKVTSDPRMQFENWPPTFDGRRLIAGGFIALLDTGNHA